MPEMPEVETVMRGIQPALEGARIRRAEAFVPRLRFPVPADFGARLTGNRVVGLHRRSKYILATLADGWTLMLHLGMSGRVTISPAPPHPPPARHDHLLIETEGGARLVFNDPRRFGSVHLIRQGDLPGHRLLAGLGPEPLGNGFSAPVLDAALTDRRTPIKAALLDQAVVAGLGNIYVCEALWRARISPRRLARTVPGARSARLVPAIRAVLSEAIASGGSSLRDYRQANGELGYFQHGFDVYNRAGAPCSRPECGAMVRRIRQAGRSSYYCPGCQR
ncbi:bifunctional DNA-formamidopyrimidine glycosylase/DNA-(apurinic or apyrimidinic site) lyase [Yunchengibacter salinarum]|uniref:bifunctional DNA-formamidopyrimidine glycosylase/DNA-(apurinic or apyrimidinic site) lyase n=1 Tax=Yunchengibacter salinarum TaxID=3133399 RepID=UPI0035B654B4